MADLRWSDWLDVRVLVTDLDGNPAVDVTCDVKNAALENQGDTVGSLEPTQFLFALENDSGKYDPQTDDPVTFAPLIGEGYDVQVDLQDVHAAPGAWVPFFRGTIDSADVTLAPAAGVGARSVVEVVCLDRVAALAALPIPIVVPGVGEGDTLAERVADVVTRTGWSFGTDLEAGGFPLTATPYGDAAANHLRTASSSAGGVVYVARDGALTSLFPAAGAVAAHFWASTDGIGTPTPGVPNFCVGDLRVNHPLASIVNHTEVNNETTQATADDLPSQARYGERAMSLSGLWTQQQADLQSLADLYLQPDPTPDLDSVTMYVEGDAGEVAWLLSSAVGARVLVTFDNGNGYDWTLDVLLTGFTVELGRGQVVMTMRTATPWRSMAGVAFNAEGVDHTHDGDYMDWQGDWFPGDYFPQQVVRDGEWTMVANKPTSDRPAPQRVGATETAYPTDPAAWATPATALVTFLGTATQFTFTESGWVDSLRAYIPQVSPTLRYVMAWFDATDPDRVIQVSSSVTPTEVGWLEMGVAQRIVLAGTKWVVALYVQQTAGEFEHSYPWLYDGRENIPADPGAGLFTRDNGNTSFAVSTLDDNGTDRSAALATMLPGDVVTIGDSEWTVQVLSVTDNGTWFNVTCSTLAGGLPATDPTVRTIRWTEVAAQPTPYVQATDWWLSNQPTFADVKGLYSEEPLTGTDTLETALANLVQAITQQQLAVEDDNGYGVDILFQEADVSDDWDLVSYDLIGSSGGGGGGGDGTPHIIDTVEPADPVLGTVWVNPDGLPENTYLPLSAGQAFPLTDELNMAHDAVGMLRMVRTDFATDAASEYLMRVSGNGLNFGVRSADLSIDTGDVFRVAHDQIRATQIAMMESGVNVKGQSVWFESAGAVNGYRIFANVSDALDFGLSFRDLADNEIAQFRNGSTFLPAVYSSTTGNAANVHVLSDGRMARSTSARRYKKGIRTLARRWGKVNLNPVTFTSRGEGTQHLGFIADELADIDERLVERNPDGEVENYDIRAVVAILAQQVNDLRAEVLRLSV